MGSYDGGVTPGRMFERQGQKGHVLRELVEAIGLAVGDGLLDVGSGPGYASLLAAEIVGPTGQVWALDESQAALEFLQSRAETFDWLHILVGDAAAFAPPAGGLRRFLLSDVLHDADDPVRIVRHLAQVLPFGARGVVSDYTPVAEKRFGPDPRKRIPADTVREWLTASGFEVLRSWEPPDEHYAFLVELTSRS